MTIETVKITPAYDVKRLRESIKEKVETYNPEIKEDSKY